jgi:hypothetical protein
MIFQGVRKANPLCGLQVTNNVEKSQKGRSPLGWVRSSPVPGSAATISNRIRIDEMHLAAGVSGILEVE